MFCHHGPSADTEIAAQCAAAASGSGSVLDPHTSGCGVDRADVVEPMIYELRIAATSSVHDAGH